MGSDGEQFDTGDALTAIRLNRKTLTADTGANCTADTKYPGKIFMPTSSNGSFVQDQPAFILPSDGATVKTFATLDATQTFTNKTLTSPTINSPTIATPTITDAVIRQVSRVYYKMPQWVSGETWIETGGVGTEDVSDSTGMLRLLTDANTNDTAFIHANDGNAANLFFRRDRKFEFTWIVVTGASVAAVEYDIGLFPAANLEDTAPQTTSHSMTFQFEPGTSANWQVRNGGGTETTTTSAISVDATTRYVLTLINDETDLKFYINGTLVATHTTNLPTSTTVQYPQMWVRTTTTAAKHAFHVDCYGWTDIA